MKTLRIDFLVPFTAILAAGGSWAWCAMLAANDGRLASVAGLQFGAAAYPASDQEAPEMNPVRWAAPKAQAAGWVYDVFTPPEIYYDARTREFRITPPELAPAAPPAAFGLELLAVSRPLFRLQLVGFAGGEGNYRGLFENMLTTETFLAAGGRRLPELGLVIESLDVRDTEVALPESMTTIRRLAAARVRDERTGELFSLTDRGRRYAAKAVATVAATGDRTTVREVREGEAVELGGARYTIEKIQLTPLAAEVTKETADRLNPERRTLTPPAAAVVTLP